MKKNIIIIISALLLIILLQCTANKKIAFNVPPGTSKENEREMINIGNRGAILFKAHCSHCHGVFSKGKDSIPNFTNKQVASYKERYKLQTEESHAKINKLAPQQLDEIFLFLNFRKR